MPSNTPHALFEPSDWEKAGRAAPLFKWAGGKRRFLWEYRELIPAFTGTYYEPFAGGLSVFFHLCNRSDTPLSARVSDQNLRLIRVYQAIKRDWRSVSNELEQIAAAYNVAEDKSAFYYRLRREHNALSPSPDAARFIFLMRAGWNGVYRVNRQGQFNVPHGTIKPSVSLPSAQDIEAVSIAFRQVQLRANSWEATVSDMLPGDFAFFDPPYYAEGRSQLYEGARSFDWLAQVRLADHLVFLAERGIDFMLTNSAHPRIVSLYQERGLSVQIVDMHRSISSKAALRGGEPECVVTPGIRASETSAQLGLRVKVGSFWSQKQ